MENKLFVIGMIFLIIGWLILFGAFGVFLYHCLGIFGAILTGAFVLILAGGALVYNFN